MLGQPTFQFPFSSSALAVCFFTPENLLAELPDNLKSWQQWKFDSGWIDKQPSNPQDQFFAHCREID